MLLVIVWLGIAAGVTIWALRARREQRLDLTTTPEGLQIVDRIDLADVRVDEPDEQRRRA
jgi:hypothetical protein